LEKFKNRYNLGLIGNCNFSALINDRASVVWMCWPRFDDSSIFGSLIDDENGGHFSIIPRSDNALFQQRYIENTNVLTSEISYGDSSFRVTDFAPRFAQYERHSRPLMLMRKIEPLRGTPQVKIVCCPKGEYGKKKPAIHFGSNHVHYGGIGEPIRLTTNVPLTYISEEKFFVLDENMYLILTWGMSFDQPIKNTLESYLYQTIEYWQQWSRQCSISRLYQKEVLRSALTLKLHQFEDTGAIIASTTTSLPESPDSGRNWDYRYCWLRDTYYTLNALNRMSRFDEMKKFAQFITNIAEDEYGRLSPVYTISGDPLPTEKILDLKGYRHFGPVRIGNLASQQIQNDVYGQVLLAQFPLFVDARFPGKVESSSLRLLQRMLSHIEKRMLEPDSTLWEYRGMKERHCYTYLFHWAGSMAASKIAQKLDDSNLYYLALRLASNSRKYIESCYDPKLLAYMPSKGSQYADASLLHLMTLGFLSPKSKRARNHLKYLADSLLTPTGHLYRYNRADDFGKPDVSFAVCTFWYVEALVSAGFIDDAFRVFENMLNYSNHLGLFSEDIHESTQSPWGNFPQTYTHVGLINAAFKLSQTFDYPEFF
jgi:GH15 family glucan-1,4-alpha-glucosidase